MPRPHFLIALLLALLVGACEQRAPTAATSGASPSPAAAASASNATSANAVASYFSGAEVQVEGDAQRAELRKALTDMLSLSADELQARRYAQYDGTKSVRTLVELISGHVVPSAPQMLDPARFYADLKTPAAQAAIRQKLDDMDKALAPAATPKPAPTPAPKQP